LDNYTLAYSLVQTAGAFVGAAIAYVVYRDAIAAYDGGIRQVYGSRATAGICYANHRKYQCCPTLE